MNVFRAAAVDEAGRLVSPATRADVEKLAREASAGSVAKAASSAEAAESSATQASSSASQAVTSAKAADTSAKASASSAAQADTSAKAAAGSATQADTSAKASAASASAAASSATRAEGAATTLIADAREFGDRVRSGEFTGDAGPANVLSIGTVSSLPPGSKATASIVGDSPSQVLNLGLVEGPEGKASTVPGPPGALANASSYVLVGPGRPDTPSTTGGVITGAEPVGAEYRSTDGAQVGAFVWMKRPGNKWVVMSGELTRQVGRGNGATYHEDGTAYQGDLRLGFTPGLVYVALGMSSGVDSGKHLILPGVRALMPNFSFNSYSSLPAPLREYYGNITISGPVGLHGTREDHLWVLPIATWPTTAMGVPA